jgi:CheY-like chemotaxis protein
MSVATLPVDKAIRVLLVDDDRDLLEILSQYLERWFDVRSVSSGQQALELLDSWIPHVLVTDIRMPDMNGFMLLQEVQKRQLGIRTIALSANVDPHDTRTTDLVSRYANRALGKPVEPERLIQVIHEVLQDDPHLPR